MTRYPRFSSIHLVLAALCLSLAGSAGAQPPTPVGDELQVNSYTTSYQRHPSVAVDPGGGFVVVWESFGSAGTDMDGRSIQGQRYDAGGNPLGGELQINSYTTGSQLSPSAAVAPGGETLVVWQSDGSSGTDNDSRSIQGQRYDAGGSPLGGELQVNSYTPNAQRFPAVAVAPGGDFVAVWDSGGSGGTDTDGSSIQGQRYAAGGSPLGGQFQVNSYTSYGQYYPAVATGPDGSFVVVWQSAEFGGLPLTRARRFAADGMPVGSDFVVAADSPEYGPAVAVDAGGSFFVVWADDVFERIAARRFAADGTPIASEFQVNTYTEGIMFDPSVAVDDDGDLVVVWTANPGLDGSASVHGRRFSSAGDPFAGDFQINSTTTGAQQSPAVSSAPNGDFVVVWQSEGSSGTDTDEESVQGQRFEVELFSDGFESGDTSAWTMTVP